MKKLYHCILNFKERICFTKRLEDKLNENGITIEYYYKNDFVFYFNDDLLIRKFKLSELSDNIQLNKYEEIIFKIFKKSVLITYSELHNISFMKIIDYL